MLPKRSCCGDWVATCGLYGRTVGTVMPNQTTKFPDPNKSEATGVLLREPRMLDGGGMWRVARDSGELDLNSSYAYLLFCRDFAATCRVAVAGDTVVGFVLAYCRPAYPARLFVWQVAVDERYRGQNVAGRLLDGIVDSAAGIRTLETTITEENAASQRLFVKFAERHGARLDVQPLFHSEAFPDDHDTESLYVISDIRSKWPDDSTDGRRSA